MAIIQCPECGGTVSTTAKQCIHCGAKINICPQCENVWAGEGSFCPKCGFNTASVSQGAPDQMADGQCQPAQNQHDPAPDQLSDAPTHQEEPVTLSKIETTLEQSRSQNIISVLQKQYPGGLKFLFKFFGIVSWVLFGFGLIAPFVCQMLASYNPTLALLIVPVSIMAAVALCLGLFTMIINYGISLFHEPAYNSVLKKQINASNFDLSAHIRNEMCNGWETSSSNEAIFKKQALIVLINHQARPESTYLRVVQHVVAWIIYVFFGIPAIVVGWAMLIMSIASSFLSSILPFTGLFPENGFTGWIVAFIVYVFVVFIGAMIYSHICIAIENKVRKKWIEKYMPDMLDAYYEHILKKKRKK